MARLSIRATGDMPRREEERERSAQTLARLRKLHTYKCNHEYIVRNDRTKKCKACGHVVNEGTRL